MINIIQPIAHPAAWRATDFKSKEDVTVELEDRHILALASGLTALKSITRDYREVNPACFPLGDIMKDIVAWREEIHRGRGLLILRGFPVGEFEVEDIRLMYLGLGSHFGRPTSQSPLGDLIGEVVDIGGKDRQERAYRSRRRLKLHTDRCDHLTMLCLRRALSGGLSGYASGLTAHNIILEERPDLLEILYRGYHHHCFGQQGPGQPLVTRERIPIFSIVEGTPSVILIRGYIDLAIEEGHIQLNDLELEALDYLEAVTERPEVKFEFMMAPGELCISNNCVLLHNRTEFTDDENPEHKRLLLRLWLREDRRPMAPGVLMHKGLSGIPQQIGMGTYYTTKSPEKY